MRLKETKLRLAALVVLPCVALSPGILLSQVASQAAAAQASASKAVGSTRQTAMPSDFCAIAVCMALTISETTFFCEPVH